MPTEDLTDYQISELVIGCAYKVHGVLKAGFVEKVYENALRIELVRAGLKVVQQAAINVMYDGIVVGEFAADLWVEERLIVELKAQRELAVENEVQLVNYLMATGVDAGLLINFGPSVTIRRKFRKYRKPTSEKNPVQS